MPGTHRLLHDPCFAQGLMEQLVEHPATDMSLLEH